MPTDHSTRLAPRAGSPARLQYQRRRPTGPGRKPHDAAEPKTADRITDHESRLRTQLLARVARLDATVARLHIVGRRATYDGLVAVGALVLTSLFADDWPRYTAWLVERDLDEGERAALSRSATGTVVSRVTRLLWIGGSWARRRARAGDAGALREWLAEHQLSEEDDRAPIRQHAG